jgi:hypothetical protein
VSNLGQDADCPDVFRGFPKSVEANTGMVLRLLHERYLQNLFLFIIYLLFYSSTLYGLRY